MYSLDNLDENLLKYLNFENGFYIEAGANDGISQSNTFLYEQKYNWTGLLVEPNIPKYNQCLINRPKSIVENYALVSENYKDKFIEGDFIHEDYHNSLTGMVMDEGDYCDNSLRFHKNERKEQYELVKVPAITLTKLLEKHNVNKVDFLSLDVKGYEISVLNGIDFEKFSPTYCLIETTTDQSRIDVISNYMKDKNYEVVERMSGNDFLYKIK